MILINRSSFCLLVVSLLASLSLAIGHHHVGHDHDHNHHHHQQYIELSHVINNQTLHWISMQNISYQVLKDGQLPRGTNKNGNYYLKIDRLEMDLHSGTHMDAPAHFSQGKWSIDQIPLDRMMNVPTYVIDLSDKCKTNRSYEFTREDIEEFEKKRQAKIAKNSVVLFYTGISEFWPKGVAEYYGTSSKEYSSLRIPGISKEVASLLVNEREIYGVGLDAPSADGTSSIDKENNMDPVAHEIFNGANVYVLENINSNLKKLINQTDVTISTLPLPIETASGCPVRLVAQIDEHYSRGSTSGASYLAVNLFSVTRCYSLAPLIMFLYYNIIKRG